MVAALNNATIGHTYRVVCVPSGGTADAQRSWHVPSAVTASTAGGIGDHISVGERVSPTTSGSANAARSRVLVNESHGGTTHTLTPLSWPLPFGELSSPGSTRPCATPACRATSSGAPSYFSQTTVSQCVTLGHVAQTDCIIRATKKKPTGACRAQANVRSDGTFTKSM